MKKMIKKIRKIWILCAVVAFFTGLVAVWAIIHRRVIRAAIRHEAYPVCPHWLPDCIRQKMDVVPPDPTEE